MRPAVARNGEEGDLQLGPWTPNFVILPKESSCPAMRAGRKTGDRAWAHPRNF